jgi:hypothetical protein
MGLLTALGEAPAIVIGLFVGVWVDRLRRRRLLVTLDLLAATAVLSVPIAYLLGDAVEHPSGDHAGVGARTRLRQRGGAGGRDDDRRSARRRIPRRR